MRKMTVLRQMMVAGILLGGLAAVGATDAPDPGIRVIGTGTAHAKATRVEIECTLNAEAELAADATVKFRDAKKRALAAIEALKNSDVSVESDGISVNSALDENALMMMRQRGILTPGTKPRVQLMEKDRICLANADKMQPDALLDLVLKILDVAKDAGFQMSGGQIEAYYNGMPQRAAGLVTFKLADGSSLRDQAYKDAIADARAKAQKLAELSGVKLGRVTSIQESGGREDKEILGGSTADLTATVSLAVSFEILK